MLFQQNAMFLYRKSHIPDAPYSYVGDPSVTKDISIAAAKILS